ncbi:hypothetical protein ACS0TY_035915 [Phlomoides rotata]
MEARTLKAISLVLNVILLGVGICGGPLIMRLYFIRGGKRVWFSAWLETGGFPIILIPVLVSYFRRRSTTTEAKLFLITPRIFAAGAGIGLLMGIDNYMYAYGVAKLPVSTSSLLIASQLVFMAGFAYVLVKQKRTAYSVNAVVLLTVGAVILGMNTGSDRPKGESNKMYWLGFILTLLAAVMYGLILPLVELVYQRAKQAITYTLVMEFQAVMGIFATAFCTVGMIVNKDFQAIPKEAKGYELGEARYYVVVVWSAIIWQCFFLGVVGVIHYSSSLFSGVVISVLLPVTEVLAVIFYHEKFQAEKGISLFLSLWGFVSYSWGDIKDNIKKKKKNKDNTSNNQSTNHELANIQTVTP